ncbi:uncharacterized protein VDAG_05644 [Verticillium dahliae VdLs.17]|uniref:Uncharacterized protein n=1 Tax=Verticillium dahliae (strain VdLs.17 / ATCC MYA-4575 / FGSC 10137) TaxID=498257 RepID=G2X662_VERDV|nr:uncharacterized protein VDAG_05644 [Verticillium dahliae VdLs.17]EGY14480.1 hypothetical protein VDAG_05644 [Verticillium dahliae VdLs.17]
MAHGTARRDNAFGSLSRRGSFVVLTTDDPLHQPARSKLMPQHALCTHGQAFSLYTRYEESMVSSHRRLAHRRAKCILSGVARNILPGEARFYSFYSPSLKGGLHTVKVSQTISAPPDKAAEGPDKDKRREDAIAEESLNLYVIAPKFNLPVGCIDSMFPAPGAMAEVTVLPHISFKDPHLPWEREAAYSPDDASDKDEKGDPRCLTPWVALLAFAVDELKLAPADLAGLLATVATEVDGKQSESMAVRMSAGQIPKLGENSRLCNALSFDKDEDAREAAEPIDVIFLPKSLFVPLFSKPGNATALDNTKHKYLAHVRQVATDGMAAAGSELGSDPKSLEAVFSIVLSHRTGPIGAPVPTNMVVHLVSLDMPTNITLPLSENVTHAALLSLHSWTYTGRPSNEDASSFSRLTHLGNTLTVVRPEMPEDRPDMPSSPSVKDLVKQRQRDGYTIVRHRTVTGEETAAMTRGPLTPTFVPHPLREGFVMQSNFGTDLQILDPDLSLMDLTYASAWQLGKTLAMGDPAFCVALSRLRMAIDSQSQGAAKRDVHTAISEYASRKDTVARMFDLVRGLDDLNGNLLQSDRVAIKAATTASGRRWDVEHNNVQAMDGKHGNIDTSQRSQHMAPRTSAHADAAAASFALATDGTLYNEHNVPTNTDSAYVYSWIIDKVHLANVPAHYLVVEPSHLPEETLRFCYFDENWSDALVDGALSLANHWANEPAADESRAAIKKAVNLRLMTPDEKLGHVQMPKFGFLMRSVLLAQFPDMTVSVKQTSQEKPTVFQFSVPEVNRAQPPELSPLPQRVWSGALPMHRPRPPSPRQEAALVAEYAEAARHAPDSLAFDMNSAPIPDPPTFDETFANRPKFRLKVYPVRSRDFVPSNTGLPLDLVFSIVYVEGRATERLRRLTVEVPCGAMPSEGRGGEDDPLLTLLSEDADPPTPTMLSNLRFNVLKRWRDDEKGRGRYLVLDLVPRSKDGVPVDKIKEASFLLSRADICLYEGAEPRFPFVNLKYDYGDWGDKRWNDGRRVEVRPLPSKSEVPPTE